MLRILFAGSLLLSAPVLNSATKVDGKPFNASIMDLAKQGYVEEEFFLTGTARERRHSSRSNVERHARGFARHPIPRHASSSAAGDAGEVHGTVVVEWTNVQGFDNEVECSKRRAFRASGYAWVGVSAQNVGVNALKQQWAIATASLDVTDNGTVTGDGLVRRLCRGGPGGARKIQLNILGPPRPSA